MSKHIQLFLVLIMMPIFLTAQYPFRDSNFKWGVIDFNLQVLTLPNYDTINLYKNGFAIAEKKGKFLHLNKKGQELYSTQYDSLGNFDYNYKNSGYAGLAVAKKGNHYGLISPSGKQAKEFPLAFDGIYLEKPGRVAQYDDPLIFIYQKNGKFGCKIDGRKVGKPVYDTIYINFGDPKNLFFKKKDKEYFLTEKRKIKSAENYEFVSWASGDGVYFVVEPLEIVEKEGLKGLRDKETGKVVVPEKYQNIQLLDNYNYVLTTPDGKCGLVDLMGEPILADQYKQIYSAQMGLLFVEEFSGRKGYLVNQQLLLPKK